MLVVLRHILVQFPKIGFVVFTKFVQTLERSFGDKAARLLLFTERVLGSREPQPAYQRRQRKALKHERHDDKCERQKNNQISMRERAAAGDCFRKRYCGSQSNHASHSGPAHHEYLASARPLLILMENARTNQVGQIRAWKSPGDP